MRLFRGLPRPGLPQRRRPGGWEPALSEAEGAGVLARRSEVETMPALRGTDAITGTLLPRATMTADLQISSANQTPKGSIR